MKAESPIRVTIYDDSTSEHCSHCGIEWSSKEAIQFVTERLREKYGDSVILEYLDLAEPSTHRQNQEVIHKINQQGLALPVVALNGVLKLCGNVEYRMIVEAIETLKEIGIG